MVMRLQELAHIGTPDSILRVCTQRFHASLILLFHFITALGIDFHQCMATILQAKKGVLHLVGSNEVVPVHNLLIMLTDTHTHLVQFAVMGSVLAELVDGKSVTTIEALSSGTELHPVQQAFVEEGAVQCGFCTPGMILSALALLRKNPYPSREEIKRGLSGNFCRCGAYEHIIRAVQKAGRVMAENKVSSR